MKLKGHSEKKTGVVSQLLLAKITIRSQILGTADACRNGATGWVVVRVPRKYRHCQYRSSCLPSLHSGTTQYKDRERHLTMP